MTQQANNSTESNASGEKRQPVLSLSGVGEGESVELVEAQGGSGLQHRLAEMGLGPGVSFRVETRGRPGPYVISVKGSRLILGRGIVQKILVRPVRSQPSGDQC